jgi:hypothetical protein
VEARAAVGHIQGKWRIWETLNLELTEGRFALAESIATAHLDDP